MDDHQHSARGKTYVKGCPGCQKLGRERYAAYKDSPGMQLAVRVGNWKKYGINVEQATAEYQKGKTLCDICGKPSNGRGGLHIDHDHATGQVRGSLCHSCNSLLGYAQDSPELLAKAIAYLKAPIT